TAARGRWETRVPVAREASINWAAASFSYATRTVPRATPSWAARSCHEGKRAPGSSTPPSMAVVSDLRICSVKGIFAVRSRFSFSGLLTPAVVHYLFAFLVLFSSPTQTILGL